MYDIKGTHITAETINTIVKTIYKTPSWVKWLTALLAIWAITSVFIICSQSKASDKAPEIEPENASEKGEGS